MEVSIAGGLACHLKATELDGSTCIFAQDIDLGADREKLSPGQAQRAPGGDITPRGGKATIKVAGLKAGAKVEVVDENRIITADEGQFTDEFGPLQEHVYRIVGK